MPTITVTKTIEVPVRIMKAEMGVRYWEDATVNGQEDKDGTLIPMRNGDTWTILIDIEDGRILGWPDGTTAKTHYKVCDAGVYSLLGLDGEVAVKIDGYVPRCLYPDANGYGDYVILDIDEGGNIKGWRADLSAFEQDEG